jgi:hypothetical protein
MVSGGAFRPPSLLGNILWLRADVGITLNVSDVAVWADQSGAGNDAVQATAADQPAFSAAGGPNSRPMVSFTRASTEFMDLTGISDASNDYTVFFVISPTADANSHTLLSTAGTVTGMSFQENVGGLVRLSDAAGRQLMPRTLLDQILTYDVDSTGTAVQGYRDGVVLGSDTASATNSFAGTTAIGRFHGGGIGYDGGISEIIVYNRVLTAAERALVHAYLSARYALAFSPLSVAGLEFWYNAANVTLTGPDVTTWQDLSGNSRDLTPPGNPPVFVGSGGPHSRGYVEFDDTNSEHLSRASWSRVQPYTTLVHCVASVSDKSASTVTDGTAFNTGVIYTPNNTQVGMFAGGGFPNVTTDATAWQRYAANFNGASSEIIVDDGVPTVGNSGALDPGGLFVGARPGPASFGDCRIDELMGYDRTLTDEELTALDGWMTP